MAGPNLSTSRTISNTPAEHVADHNTLHQVADLLDLTTPPIFTSNRPVALMDTPGIDWTGAADSSTAVQAAITAAGAGTKIELGRGGRLRLDTGLTLLNFQTLEGPVFNLGSGATSTVDMSFTALTGAQAGITCGQSNTLRNLQLRGPGPTVGTVSGILANSASPRLDKVQMYNFYAGLKLISAFYVVLNQCEWQYNQFGVILTTCFNVSAWAPRFNCADAALANFYTAFSGAARALNIFGGSIENYGVNGAIRPDNSQAVNVFGTYFESSRGTVTPFGIYAVSKDKVTINVTGCFVYLTESNRFVDVSGATNSTLVGRGNRFICSAGSTTTPIGYVLGGSPTTDVDLVGDDWSEMAKGSYTDNSTALSNGGLSGVNIRHPAPYATYGTSQFIGRDLNLIRGKVTLNTTPIVAGTGTPEGAVAAPIGSLFLRSDGSAATTLYAKESGAGNTGWTAARTAAPDIQVFTGSGTWTKPAGAKLVKVIAIGGGSGGGSGRRGAAGTVRCGGGGGSGNGWTLAPLDPADLTSTVSVTIGTGGTGGAAVTANDTNGNAGGLGTLTSFGAYAVAAVGTAAAGGTATTGTGGNAGVGGVNGNAGGSASATGGTGGNGSIGAGGPGAGGSGGGITSGDAASAGGAGPFSRSVASGSNAGGVVDSTAPSAGTAPTAKGAAGHGAGGGAGSITTAAQAGATAVGYGSGGGGGGASLNGNNSGAGGNGAPGYCLVITTF